MRDYLNEHEDEYEADDDNDEGEEVNHSSILLGSPSGATTKEDLLNSVPSRNTCDQLVSQWFNSQDPGTCKYLIEPLFTRDLF